MSNVYNIIESVCKKNKDKIFFLRENETYLDFLNSIKKRAIKLQRLFKIKKSDTVAILSSNVPSFIKSYFALLSQGVKVLMLDVGLSKEEQKNMMNKTNCKLALAQKKYFIDDINMFDIEQIDDEDIDDFKSENIDSNGIAMLSFTSGSTGNPKIVGLTHNNLIALANGCVMYKSVVKPEYIFYGFLPLYHIYGVVINIFAPIMLECKLLLQPVLNPRLFVEDFKKYKPEIIPAVPRIWETFYKKICDNAKEHNKYFLMMLVLKLQKILKFIGLNCFVSKVQNEIKNVFGGNIKILISAGATLKPNIRNFFESVGIVMGDCYGLTETTGPAYFNLEHIKDNGSICYGSPLIGNELKIENKDKNGIGDIMVKGSLVMNGYINNDEANKNVFINGWFKTGDIGLMDKKNRLVVKARKKQVIVLDSGKNIYPDELEDIFLKNDEILAVAVFEYVIRGKVVPYAVFQVKEGTTIQRVNLLIKTSQLTIAPYKWVKYFAITEKELPQTAAKKIKHFEVKKMLDAGMFMTNEKIKQLFMNNYDVFYFDIIDSTQNYANTLINNNKIKNSTIIISLKQTNGRGKGQRIWKSPKGNLYISYIYKIDEIDNKISYKIALAIHDLLVYFNIQKVNIKWPNDILINDEKCCGILIEYNKNYVIIGIGINTKIAPKIQYKTTNIFKYMNEIDNNYIIEKLTEYIEKYINSNFEFVRENWNKYASNINKEIIYKNEKYILLGLDENGELMLQNKEGVNKICCDEIFL